MADNLLAPFVRQYAGPIELYRQVADITARDAITPSRRWEGMPVYVIQTETTYKLVGGITNSDWVTDGGGLSGITQSSGLTTFTLPDTSTVQILTWLVIAGFNILKRQGNLTTAIQDGDKIEGWEGYPDRDIWIEGVVLDSADFALPADLRDTDKFFLTNEKYNLGT